MTIRLRIGDFRGSFFLRLIKNLPEYLYIPVIRLRIPVIRGWIYRSTANSQFWALSWNFLCADMFPCEDFKTVSVCLSICPYPEKRNHHSLVNMSPTLVIDTSMERPSRVLQHGNPKIWFSCKKKHVYLSVSAVIFHKQFLAYTVHIDWCYHAIHKHSCRSVHIFVLTTCTFMLVCTIEPSFLRTTSGMHRRLFEGRHLVWLYFAIWFCYTIKHWFTILLCFVMQFYLILQFDFILQSYLILQFDFILQSYFVLQFDFILQLYLVLQFDFIFKFYLILQFDFVSHFALLLQCCVV